MKLTRRRVGVTALIFVIVAAFSLVYLIVFGGDQITQANVDRIQDGMSMEQVLGILGGPPSRRLEWHDGFDRYMWDGVNGSAYVTFTNKGATGCSFTQNSNTWWSRVKRFFGL